MIQRSTPCTAHSQFSRFRPTRYFAVASVIFVMLQLVIWAQLHSHKSDHWKLCLLSQACAQTVSLSLLTLPSPPLTAPSSGLHGNSKHLCMLFNSGDILIFSAIFDIYAQNVRDRLMLKQEKMNAKCSKNWKRSIVVLKNNNNITF